jgi:polyisoprenoid-binding protein YceI
MKNYFLLALTALSLLSAGLPGQSDYRISKGYEVTIHGTMSIHDWVETIGTVTGDIVAGRHTDGGVDLSSIRISMTVRSIKSDMGTVMDNRTYKALKADADPEIIFQVDAPALIMPMRGKEAPVSLQGHLTLAGMTRVVALRITYLDISQDSMRFEGEQTINMTDFGVKPPSALFGTLRAGPDITIYFKTVFTIQQK